MVKSIIHNFHHLNITKPNSIAIEDPSKLTISGENLLKFVITIGNSSPRIKDCNKNPIIILDTIIIIIILLTVTYIGILLSCYK